MSKLNPVEMLEALEAQKEAANADIEFAVRVNRLLANPDFRHVILDTYCVKEAAAFVHTSADPILKPEQRADALSMAQATGHLKRWLRVVELKADQAKDRLPEIDEHLEAVRYEIDNPSTDSE
jgi:hypothetical protein